MCPFAASSQIEPLHYNMVLEAWRQATSASKGWSQILSTILYYTNQGIIPDNWKAVLSVKPLESFHTFRLAVLCTFSIVLFLKKWELQCPFFIFLRKILFSLFSTREFSIVPLAVHLEIVLHLWEWESYTGNESTRERQKGGFTASVSILFPLTKASKPVNLFHC